MVIVFINLIKIFQPSSLLKINCYKINMDHYIIVNIIKCLQIHIMQVVLN